MTALDEAIAREWAEALPLLERIHERHPRLTIGEIVHLAAQIGGQADAVHSWDAGVGSVADGLQKLLDVPEGEQLPRRSQKRVDVQLLDPRLFGDQPAEPHQQLSQGGNVDRIPATNPFEGCEDLRLLDHPGRQRHV